MMKKYWSAFFVLFCLLSINLNSQNLITNGDFGTFNAGIFSPPILGFTTTHTQIPYNGASKPGTYAITNDPFILSPGSLYSAFDTKDGIIGNGTGNMMYVDGDKNKVFWKQDPPLLLNAGKTYTFSYWIRNVNQTVNGGSPPPTVKYNPVGCSSCITQSYTTALSKNWERVTYQVIPTVTQLVSIELSTVNANSIGGHNFAIDDISLIPPVIGLTISSSQINPSCINSTDGSIVVYPNSGVAPFTYNLTGAKTDTNSTGVFKELSSGTYSVSVTDSDIIPVTKTIETINLVAPVNIAVNVSPSGCILAASQVSLTATNGGSTYKWNADTGVPITDTDNVVVVNPLIKTVYTVESTIDKKNQNLVKNNGFEEETSGFYTDYVYSNLNTSGAKFAYGIISNPKDWSNGFITSTDKSGFGKMLVASGSTTANTTIWSQSIPVSNNSIYSFSFWAQNVIATSPAQFQVLINGTPIVVVPISAANGSSSGWTEIKGVWNSSTSSVAKLEILNTNITSIGNDFAIDDISFSTSTPKTCLLSGQVTVNIGGTTPITAFSYSTPICKSSLNSSPNPASGFLGGGVYSESTGLLSINSLTGVIDLTLSPSGNYTVKYAVEANATICQTDGFSTFQLTINNTLEAPNVISPINYCRDSIANALTSTTVTGAKLNWYGTNSTGGSPSLIAPIPSTGNDGSIIYYVSQSIGLCESPRSAIVVNVNVPPNAGTLSGNQNVCLGLKTSFESTVSGGVWSSSNSLIANVESSTGVISGLTSGTSTITYTVSGLGGCANASESRDVIYSAGADSGLISGTQTVCIGKSTAFESTASGGIWGSSDAGIATVNNVTGVVMGVSEGTAAISYTVIGSGGCSDSIATRNVIVNVAPSAGIIFGNQNICLGLQTTFSSSSSGGTWSSSDTSIATIDSSTGLIKGITIGTATMTYMVSGLGSCSDASATRVVTFNAGSDAGVLSGIENVCIGKSTVFSSSVSGGIWSSSNSTIAKVDSLGEVIGVVPGTAAISYTVIGSGGCSDSIATRNVIVNVAPSAGIVVGNQNICLGLQTTFSSSSSGGTWSSSDTSIATIDSSTGLIKGITIGTATMTYMVSGLGSCSDASATRVVTFSAGSDAGVLSGIENVCIGKSTVFSSSVSGGIWSSSNSTIAKVDSLGEIIGVVPGTATITYTVSGTGGCLDAIATRDVMIKAIPNAGTLIGNQNVCLGFTTIFSSSSSAGTWSSLAPNIATVDASGVITGVAVGTATITYTVLGLGGCSDDTATRDVTFNIDYNAGTLIGISNVCEGLTSSFSSSISGGTWSSSNTAIATVDTTNGFISGVSSGKAIITYTIAATQGQCIKTSTTAIEVNSSIIPTFNSVNPICYGEALDPLPIISINGIKGNWSPLLDNLTTKKYTFTPDSNQECATEQDLTITVKDLPEFEITGECNSKNYELSTNSNSKFSYTWLNPMSESISTAYSAIVTKSGNYSLEVVSDGCKSMKQYEVKNVSCNYPKGISPNSDEYNNFFDLGNFEVKRLQIYNRYGQEVYSKNNYKNEWSGSSNDGKELPDGTYYYVITLLNNDKPETGWVYINR